MKPIYRVKAAAVTARQTSVCLLLLLVFSGCGDARMARLAGTWTLDQPDRVQDRINSSEDDPNQLASTTDSNLESRMTLIFAGNGTLETQTAMGTVQRQKKGTWQVNSFDESTGKMTITCQIGLQETDHDVVFEDSDTIRLLPPNMAGLSMKMRFRRVH